MPRSQFPMLAFVVGSLALPVACAPAPSLDEQMEALAAELALPSDASLERVLTTAHDRFALPGIAAALVSSTQVLDASAVGDADSVQQIDLGLDHRFDVNSLTKSFTALVVAELVEDGRLGYDQPVADALPGLDRAIHTDYAGVTIDELLHHTAGLSRNGEHIDVTDRLEPGSASQARARFAQWIFAHPRGAPRGTYSYSNAGYIVLGAIVEATTGRSWESEVRERIFEPLGLTSGSFGWLAGDPGRYAIGHRRTPDGGFVQRNAPDGWYLYEASFPAGGVQLSTRDLAAYARYHLNGLAGRVDRLSASSFAGLHHIDGLYGRGWFASEFDRVSGSVHDGSDDGYYAKIFISTEADLGVVILSNIDDGNAWRACNLVAYWLLTRHGAARGPASGLSPGRRDK